MSGESGDCPCASHPSAGCAGGDSFQVEVPTSQDMLRLGGCLASCLKGGDVVVLSGPLGAGKTTLAQGLGRGLHVDGPVVSPTFTIARELRGRLATGQPVRLVHVDAYRLGGMDYVPGENRVGLLLDELESIGLDEELEEPGQNTVVLMEWGSQMASALSDQRLDLSIDRPLAPVDPDAPMTNQGRRLVTMNLVGPAWTSRKENLRKAVGA